MKTNTLRHIFSVLLAAIVLISCQSGGGSIIADGGGIGGTGVIAVGAVHSLGSIVVNGSHFDTSDAVVVVNDTEIGVGDEAVRNNLDVGKIVMVEGRTNPDDTGFIADYIRYHNRVVGPVEAIDQISDDAVTEIIVLGQNVIVNSLTRLKTTFPGGLMLNDFVEISGYVDGTGAIRATFVENFGPAALGEIVGITGIIENLDLVQQTFSMNNLIVDYTMADTSTLPDGVLRDGLPVEVEGLLVDAANEMRATAIELEDGLGTDNADLMEVIGFVTGTVSNTEFTIGRQRVIISNETLFIDGRPDEVFSGSKIEAGGRLVDGVLMAEEIEFWGPDQIEIEDTVTSVLSISEFAIGDQWVKTDAETQFVGGQPGDLTLNIMIEVKGRIVDTVLLADKVSFEDE